MQYQLFAPLSEAEYEALKQDIGARGVLVPVEEDEHGNVLDGHHRVQIAAELGIDYPRLIRAGMTEEEKRSHVRKINLLRRHLNQEQKRAVIAEQLKQAPHISDRLIAGLLGVHHSTVGAVRDVLAAAGELANLASSIGADGKERPRDTAPRTVIASTKSDAKQAQAALLALDESSLTVIDEAYERHGEIGTLYEVDGWEKCLEEGDEEPPLVPASPPVLQTVAEVKKQARKLEQPPPPPTPSLPEGKYDLILADPPWQTNFRRGTGRDVENHYAPMPLEDIQGLCVGDLAAPDCVLLLWATSPLLPAALQTLEAWGFEYKTSAVWHKSGMGMGYYFRIDHEFLLVGTKGQPGAPAPSDRPSSVIYSEKGAHSQKPQEFHEVIERMYPDAKRIELFARKARPGWALWGAEAPAL